MPTLALATIALLIEGCPTPGGGGETPPSTPPSAAKAITAFSFASPAATGVINEYAKTIAVTVPYGTNVTALVAAFTTTGSSVKVGSAVQVSGVTANNFSGPVIYAVTAADGSTASYTVTVTVALSSDKTITAFSFASPAATGTIDENAKTMAVTVPYCTDVTALVAIFTTTGASVKVGSTVQVSGITANNFTGPVIYAVTAADGSAANYTATVTVAPQAWQVVGTEGFSASSVGHISLAIDTAGTPYVAYLDSGNGGRLTVMKYSGGSWQTVGIAGFSVGQAQDISLAIDTAGTPYVAYVDFGINPRRAAVWKYDGGSWQTVGPLGFSPDGAYYTSLAIDSMGIPYVAYLNGYLGGGTLENYTGGQWQLVPYAWNYFCGGTIFHVSLAIDSTDTPYVAYQDWSNSGKATVKKCPGGYYGSWQTVGTAGFSADQAPYTSLAIDSSGTPYVAFVDHGNSDKATVMKYSGGSWQVVGTAGLSLGTATYTSLAIDSTGTLYVAYEDNANSGKATVMKYAGGSWQTVGIAGFSAGIATYTSLALDSTGTPYVAYQDSGNGYKATVMRFK